MGFNELALVGLAVLTPVLAFIVFVARLGHPHHRKIALGLYLAGWIPFSLALQRHGSSFEESLGPATGYLTAHWAPLVAGGFSLLLAWVIWLIIPHKRSFLGSISESERAALLAEDIPLLRYMIFRMDLVFSQLVLSGLLENRGSALSSEEETTLRRLWGDFVAATFECDLLKQRYRAFPEVSVRKSKQHHFQCFLVAYGAFLAQYRAGLRLSQRVASSDSIKSLLNEPSESFPSQTFAAIQKRSITPESVVQLNVGRAYLSITTKSLQAEEDITNELDRLLSDIDAVVAEDPRVFVGNPLDYFESKAFKFWLPVQKSIAVHASHIRTVSRPYFVPPEALTERAGMLEPGDILLQRREWHLTNLGIPGYWTHLALYVGTPERLNDFFSDIPATTDTSASEILFASCETARATLGHSDEEGFPLAVIEALRPGVVLTSLEVSGSTDALAVLRPRQSKAKRLQGLLRAFEHLGKPYDYNFDFATDQALVCSELVYKAFRDLDILQPERVGGRLLLSPNLLAERFDTQLRDSDVPELEFVLFLDGLGEIGQFEEADSDAFRLSHKRAKWHVLTEDGTS